MNSSDISNLIATTISLSNGQLRWIELPKGVHTIDATISIEPNDVTVDCSGCKLNVTGPHTAFRLRGQRNEIVRGRFIRQSMTAECEPMFCIENSMCSIDTVQMECGGNGVGVRVRALAGELDSAGNQRFAYYSRIESCIIQRCDYALSLGVRSNMARVTGCHASHVNGSFVYLSGSVGSVVSACTMTGGQSASYSPFAVILEPSTDNGVAFNSQHNRIDLSAEPGGVSYPYAVGMGCNDNQLILQANCSQGGVNNGLNNYIIYRGNRSA